MHYAYPSCKKAMYSRCPKKVGAIHIHTNLVSLIYLSIAFVRMLYISCICHTHNKSILMMHSCLSLASEQCFRKTPNIPIPGIGAVCIKFIILYNCRLIHLYHFLFICKSLEICRKNIIISVPKL